MSDSKPTARTDIVTNMLSLASQDVKGNDMFESIMTDDHKTPSSSRQGYIYESICMILIITKCMCIDYTQIFEGQLQSLKSVFDIRTLLKVNIQGGGNNISDFTLKMGDTLVVFSIKYKNGYGETDVSKIHSTITEQKITDNFSIGLIVKDKTDISGHRYNNQENIDKKLLDKVTSNGLLFDKNDVITALDVFRERFSNNTLLDTNDFIEFINEHYLHTPRKQLTKKTHQYMVQSIFSSSVHQSGNNIYCLAHKMRSGKSITMLLLCKYLLENSYKKVLIMTSVPATIDSFIESLNTFIDFKNIRYKSQKEFDTVDEKFNGIVFCSVQYLKIDGKVNKKELLKKIGFDAMFIDEGHFGSSNNRTRTGIVEPLDRDAMGNIEDIRTNIKLTVFASGTADKIIRYWGIPSSRVYRWDIEDEAHMKQINNPKVENKEELISYMVNRHGPEFTNSLQKKTVNHDYSGCPTQVLMKASVDDDLIQNINEYNDEHKTTFGYSASSLFALTQSTDENGEKVYLEEFAICNTSDGEEIMKDYLDRIISNNRMRKTIMKQIEQTQTSYGSRKSTKTDPLLFIVFLPTHTRNNVISKLQRTLYKFLKTHGLWSDYNVEYSSATEDTGNTKEEYNVFIQTIMNNTKKDGNKGCILLLGDKGTVGITYDTCDVTISLDDGQNLDNQCQRMARALTPAPGKTVGINVDMNIQRSYLYLNNVVQKYRRNTKTKKTNSEILYYLYENNIFLFDPQQFNNGKMKTVEIQSYFQKEAEEMMNVNVDDTQILQDIRCDDVMRHVITNTCFRPGNPNKKVNEDLEGEQQHCPKGDKTKTEIDAPHNVESDQEDEKKLTEEEITKNINLVNETFELCKGFLFPLLALISKSYKVYYFNDIFTNEKTTGLIISLLIDKKIELNKDNYFSIINIMNTIIHENEEIVNTIREIYSTAPANKLRVLIEKHFIPTDDEKKKNAEVPTPVVLVSAMLDAIPEDFWKTPKKVFEPCCGKGNFVLGIFDKFYKGLEQMYPDEIERCRIIITECIYYADLTCLNVFITTELLKCHIQSYCGLDELDFEFNNHVGDTLELNIENKWNINGFSLVCGNPPYNASGDTATGNTIWQSFTRDSLNKWLLPNGYLLFVHPPGWRKPNSKRGKFVEMFELMTKQNQMLYLDIHGTADGKKIFNCGTRYDWYLIEKRNQYKNSIVIDEHGNQIECDLSELSWLSNSKLLEIKKILAKNDGERCPIMYDRTAYGADKKDRVSSKETSEFKYPCVHSTPKAGTRYMYSNVNDRGHFGVPKVIFGESGIYNPIIDMEGKYAMTHGAMAIQVDNLEEATCISKAIQSDEFDKVIKSCIFSSFRIDWNVFKQFKKDFWKEFV